MGDYTTDIYKDNYILLLNLKLVGDNIDVKTLYNPRMSSKENDKDSPLYVNIYNDYKLSEIESKTGNPKTKEEKKKEDEYEDETAVTNYVIKVRKDDNDEDVIKKDTILRKNDKSFFEKGPGIFFNRTIPDTSASFFSNILYEGSPYNWKLKYPDEIAKDDVKGMGAGIRHIINNNIAFIVKCIFGQYSTIIHNGKKYKILSDPNVAKLEPHVVTYPQYDSGKQPPTTYKLTYFDDGSRVNAINVSGRKTFLRTMVRVNVVEVDADIDKETMSCSDNKTRISDLFDEIFPGFIRKLTKKKRKYSEQFDYQDVEKINSRWDGRMRGGKKIKRKTRRKYKKAKHSPYIKKKKRLH